MKTLGPRRFLPGGADRGREPRASELILGVTAVVVLTAVCLHLLAAAA